MSLPGKVVDALSQADDDHVWGGGTEEDSTALSAEKRTGDGCEQFLGNGQPSSEHKDSTGPGKLELQSFSGQVARVRWYSTKMFFFDVVGEASEEEPDLDRLACVYRQGAEHSSGRLTTSDVVRYASEIHLGDIVTVSYFRRPLDTSRGERSVEVHEFRVDVAWKDSNPDGKEFDEEVAPPPLPEKTIETATWKARAPKGELCKFWVNSGRCPLRACTLLHVAEEERAAARKAWQEERVNRRKEVLSTQAARAGDTVAMHDKKHKKYRAEALCNWLLEKVGKEKMSAGSGVLDIAGGKGEISKHLFSHGIPCTVIDPRRCPPRNGASAPTRGPNYLLANFDDDLLSNPEHAAVLDQAAFVIGMHPDQATEPILDFALERRKPFAVVPCCVFPRQSGRLRTKVAGESESEGASGEGGESRQHRKAEGDLVVSYPDFVDYLQAKHPLVERTFLQFQGRNAVLHLFDYGTQPSEASKTA